jgi:hypothetical protein
MAKIVETETNERHPGSPACALDFLVRGALPYGGFCHSIAGALELLPAPGNAKLVLLEIAGEKAAT